jgi:FkbM family methyltransferase
MRNILQLFWRRVFPSHVSVKEFLRFAFAGVGLDVRLKKLNRVRGWNLLDDIFVLIPKNAPQIVFDVGAHRGESLFKIYNLLRSPVVHSFEPSPDSFASLSATFRDWPGLQLNNLALGEAKGEVGFRQYHGSAVNSVLPIHRNTPNVLRDVPLLETVTVKMDTLDDYCARKDVDRIDWLKIDAQGYDLNVLKGARQVLAEARVALVSLEVNFIPMYEGEGTFCEILSYMESRGYKLVDLYEKNYVNNTLSCCDLLFVRNREVVPRSQA